MENIDSKFEEVLNTFGKYVKNTDNVGVVGDIIRETGDETLKELFVKESGKFLTDCFTFLKDMDKVPQMYRERLFDSFFGKNVFTMWYRGWYRRLFNRDETYQGRLSSHINCLMKGFINEQKRKYGIKNVKKVGGITIRGIKYIETYYPQGGGGTGYSEPEVFYVETEEGEEKRVWIDTWYRPCEMVKPIFMDAMRNAFGDNIKNMEEAYRMYVDEIVECGVAAYTKEELLDPTKVEKKLIDLSNLQ